MQINSINFSHLYLILHVRFKLFNLYLLSNAEHNTSKQADIKPANLLLVLPPLEATFYRVMCCKSATCFCLSDKCDAALWVSNEGKWRRRKAPHWKRRVMHLLLLGVFLNRWLYLSSHPPTSHFHTDGGRPISERCHFGVDVYCFLYMSKFY